MKRRGYIAGVGASIAAAGCTTALDDGAGGTPTRTQTPTPTETPEPMTRPRIIDVAPVSEWNEWGDLYRYEIDEAPIDDFLLVAHRKALTPHDGAIEYTVQVELQQEDGGSFTRQTWSEEMLVDRDERDQWEGWTDVSTTDLSAGQYRAEVLVRDDVTNEISNLYESSSFDLIDE